jgi:hypothetical protein
MTLTPTQREITQTSSDVGELLCEILTEWPEPRIGDSKSDLYYRFEERLFELGYRITDL